MGADINRDFESLWPVIAARHTPPGPVADCVPRGMVWGADWVKALILSRTVYYTGTCSGQAAIQTAQTQISATNMIAQGASAIPIVGGALGSIAGILDNIFKHHAQAVANEQAAECAVKQICDQTIPLIDSAVANGSITAAQGIEAMRQTVAQCKSILAPVTGAGSGSHPCNAGCCFGYWLDCHYDFAETYYMELTPLPSPATNPRTYSPASPASVGQALADSIFPPPGSPTVSTFPWGFALFSIAAFAIVIYLIRKF